MRYVLIDKKRYEWKEILRLRREQTEDLACAGPTAVVYSPHMASKKTTLESLAKLISESSASADTKFAAL